MTVRDDLIHVIESVLFSANKPMTEQKILEMFDEEERPSVAELRAALYDLQEDYKDRGVELLQVANGFQFMSNAKYSQYIARLFEEKPAKYSRALMETLALVAYRQPITRGEIEEIRGVSVSSSIFKTLNDERSWIKVVGHKEVPGRPALYATTKEFLDYFGLDKLDALPPLPEILNMDETGKLQQQELDLEVDEDENDNNESESNLTLSDNLDTNEEDAESEINDEVIIEKNTFIKEEISQDDESLIDEVIPETKEAFGNEDSSSSEDIEIVNFSDLEEFDEQEVT